MMAIFVKALIGLCLPSAWSLRLPTSETNGNSHEGLELSKTGQGMLVDSLYRMAQREEGIQGCGPPQRPFLLMWPRSFMERADLTNSMVKKKTRKYNFIGHSWSGNFRGQHRTWMTEFAKHQFKDNDFYADTGDQHTDHVVSLGAFDHTQEWKMGTSNSISYHDDEVPYDEKYMRTMAESEFTLCPAGDQPWSYRFLEAIFAKSIPIVESAEEASSEKHDYGKQFKYTPSINFHYFTLNKDPHFEYVYNQTWAEENLQKAKQHHTLMKEYGVSVDSSRGCAPQARRR